MKETVFNIETNRRSNERKNAFLVWTISRVFLEGLPGKAGAMDSRKMDIIVLILALILVLSSLLR